MTRGRGDSGAGVTRAKVSGAEMTRGRGGSGAEVSVNRFKSVRDAPVLRMPFINSVYCTLL